MVGLGGLEPPTSSLSGMRSSHLSYRPKLPTGGAGRDRTGDLLNANQALSQLSYSPKFSSRPVGCRDRRVLLPGRVKKNSVFQVEMPERAHYLCRSAGSGLEWNGCFLLGLAYTPRGVFR